MATILVDGSVGAYFASRGAVALPDDAASVAHALAALHRRGRAAHPDIQLSETAFAEHLGRCGAAIDGEVGASAVHAEDLYLCCAAMRGSLPAVQRLRRRMRPTLIAYVGRIDSSPVFLDDIEQQLWDSLLVGTEAAPPKLGSYAGRGQLSAWIGVTAQHLALMQRRHQAVEDRAIELFGREIDLSPSDPELAFVKHRLRAQFRQALTRGLEALADREKMIYRLYVVDGLSLDRIARIYGVSQSTISRRLSGARASILAEARRVLCDEMHIPADEYESVARLLVSQLDLSISRILRT